MYNRDEINLAWDDANSDESCAMVSVNVATVALSVVVAVARLARASTVLAWWFVRLVESIEFALGKCCPAVRRRFALHLQCAFAKWILNLDQVWSRSGRRFHSFRSSLNTPVFFKQSRDIPTICLEVKGVSPKYL